MYEQEGKTEGGGGEGGKHNSIQFRNPLAQLAVMLKPSFTQREEAKG